MDQPSNHCLTILQDHGEEDGGWGPAAISWGGSPPRPFVYTGSDPKTIEFFSAMAEKLAESGKPTKLVRYSNMTVVAEWGDS